jgi:PilZ domain-containing protein
MCEDGRDVQTWARFTDISIHGCYVEAQATYPVGTVLHMKLEANGAPVDNKGTVRVSYPYLGMGIAFTDVSEETRERRK